MDKELLLDGSDLKVLNEIVLSLYQNYHLPVEKKLHNALVQLKKIVQYEKADIMFFHCSDNDIRVQYCIPVDWNQEDLQAYMDHYYSIDDILPIMKAESPLMFRTSDIFNISNLDKSRYYKELFQPLNILYSLEGNILYDETMESFGEIGLFRTEKYDDFTCKDLQILKLLQPHISNASKELSIFDTPRTIDSRVRYYDVFHGLHSLGLCLYDHRLNFLYCNQGYIGLFEKYGYHIEEESVKKRITSLCESLEKKTPDECLEYKFCDELGKPLFYITVSLADIGKHGRGYVVVLNDLKIANDNMKTFATKYGLTNREIEVLQCLVDGKDNKTIAEELFVSLSVIKKHVSNILLKAEATSRTHLLSRISFY